jgi:hypothetical protein
MIFQKYEAELLKTIIIIVGYNLNNLSPHMKISLSIIKSNNFKFIKIELII